MAMFCLKNLDPLIRVGERLKKTREQQLLSTEEVSKKTRIPLKYIHAIEAGHFSDLPATKAHQLAYVREYAHILQLNPASILYQFSQESNLTALPTIHPKQGFSLWRINSLSHVFKFAAITVLLTGFVGYLAWQINGVLQPPKLYVFTPLDGYISNRLGTTVQGETEKEVRLTINGKEAMLNNQGKFELPIDLSNGVNTITISATKKHGKTTTVTRHVIVRPHPITMTEPQLSY